MMDLHQCPQSSGLSSSSIRFEQQISQLWPMYRILRFKGTQVMDDLIESLAPFCGWTEITKAQCMLVGCCWSEAKTTCMHPVDLSGHTQESVSQVKKDRLVATGFSLVCRHKILSILLFRCS
jgi:hypothetical protein